MRLLGLACGQEDGSAEVLLKAALTAAVREGTAVEMVYGWPTCPWWPPPLRTPGTTRPGSV